MTQPLLAQFERPTEQLTEREICNELLALRNQDSESLGEQERTELDAEIHAFLFFALIREGAETSDTI